MNTSKIIKAYIRDGTYSTTEPITQGDYGYILQIEGVVLPSVYRVDFSNDRHKGEALPVYGNENGVEVPEELIVTGKDIFAFYFYLEEGFGKTVYTWKIPNDTRAQNGNREPTPTQQDSIDQLVVRSNEAVERAEQAKTDAEIAQGKAEDAQEAAETAQIKAEDAQGASERAKQSAEQSAEEARQKADSITGLVAEATTLPEGSSATASYSNGTLTLGIPKGDTGEQGIQGPKGDKGDKGDTGATGAKGDKGDKGDTGAQGIQGEQGIQGIQGEKGEKGDKGDTGEVTTEEFLKAFVTDTASGSIASFPDGADGIPLKSLMVDINPVQDLHGYDSPWVGGGGKNLLDPTLLKDQVAWNVIPFYAPVGTVLTMSTNCEDSTTSTGLLTFFRQPNGTQGAGNNVKASHPVTQTIGDSGYIEIVQRNPSNTVSYADFQWQIEVGSTATDWTPYENICPITGFTRLNMYRTGGNLICKTLPEDAFTCGSLSTGDTAIPSGSLYRAYCVYVGKNTAIRYKKETTNSFTVGLAFADEYITQRADSVIYDALNMANRSNNTLNSGEHPYLVIVVAKSSVDDQAFNKRGVRVFFKTDDGDPIEYSPTRNIDKYAYDWTEEAGTVYSVKLDVLTGILTVDMLYKQVTSEFLSSQASGYIGYTASVSALGNSPAVWVRNLFSNAKGRVSNGIKALCNAFPILMNSTAVSSSQDRAAFAVDGTNIASVADFISAVQTLETNGDGLWVCYELATPLEYQLEPHDLASILGGNQLWVDNGTIDVEYRADTKLYINRLTEPDADMIADANITSGSYFMVGNNLYKATANIASGSAVIVGTNCTRKSLPEALNEINT